MKKLLLLSTVILLVNSCKKSEEFSQKNKMHVGLWERVDGKKSLRKYHNNNTVQFGTILTDLEKSTKIPIRFKNDTIFYDVPRGHQPIWPEEIIFNNAEELQIRSTAKVLGEMPIVKYKKVK